MINNYKFQLLLSRTFVATIITGFVTPYKVIGDNYRRWMSINALSIDQHHLTYTTLLHPFISPPMLDTVDIENKQHSIF